MTLLDSNRDQYFFKWTKNYDVEIMNESDNIIGKIKHSRQFFTEKWKLFDDDNSVILTTSDVQMWNKMVIKNHNNDVLGFVSQKLFAPIKTEIIKNKNKKVILTLQTKDGLNYEITDPLGLKIAEIIPDSSGRFFRVLKIFDKTFDKKLLLGSFIGIIDYFWPPNFS